MDSQCKSFEKSSINGTEQKNPDYKMMGESFGVKSIRLNIDKSFKKKLKKHLSYKGVRLIEILI